MKSKTAINIHLFLLAFLGLSAMGGGALIISPSGKLLGGLPLSILQYSPFNSFLIPGIILFVVLGLFPILIIFALRNKTSFPFAEHFNFFKDMHWAWSFSIYVAFALIIWIQVETNLCAGRWLAANFLYAIFCPLNFCCIVATG